MMMPLAVIGTDKRKRARNLLQVIAEVFRRHDGKGQGFILPALAQLGFTGMTILAGLRGVVDGGVIAPLNIYMSLDTVCSGRAGGDAFNQPIDLLAQLGPAQPKAAAQRGNIGNDRIRGLSIKARDADDRRRLRRNEIGRASWRESAAA